MQDLYCHQVGLDTAAEEATAAFSDHVTPTRKLEGEKKTSNPRQLASGYDCHLTDRDDECSEGQMTDTSMHASHCRYYWQNNMCEHQFTNKQKLMEI